MGLKSKVKSVTPKIMLKLYGYMKVAIIRLIFKAMSVFDRRNLCVIMVDGGLGSQINKLALGLNMEKRGYLVKYDFSVFKNGQKDILGKENRNFDLDKVYLGKLREATVFDCKYTKYINHFFNKNLYEYEELFTLKSPVYVDGYFDNIQLWNNVKEILKEKCFFSCNETTVYLSIKNEIMKNSEAVVIHIRRGDYVNSIHDVTTKEYFVNAIKVFKEKLEEPIFYIFTTDYEWSRENIIKPFSEYSFVLVDISTNDTGYDDIALMNCARNFILSNSSFSMMGAFFSIYDDVNIILPNIWFKEYPESIFEKYYSKHYNQDEIILLSQKVHDINGKTLFLGC